MQPKNGLVDELATFIAREIPTEASIQPLDWTGGALHAMLLTRRKIATRFLYDYQFYHHVSNPVIQGLRREFLLELTAKPPDFILDVRVKPRVSGADSATTFPELERFLAAHYSVDKSRERFYVYRLRTRFE